MIKKTKFGYAISGILTSVSTLFNKMDDNDRYTCSISIDDETKDALQAVLKTEGKERYAGKKFKQTGVFKGDDEEYPLSFGKLCIRGKSSSNERIKLYDARSGSLVPMDNSSEFGIGNEVQMLLHFYAGPKNTLNVGYDGLVLRDTGTATPYGIDDAAMAEELGLDLAEADEFAVIEEAVEEAKPKSKAKAEPVVEEDDDFDEEGLFD